MFGKLGSNAKRLEMSLEFAVVIHTHSVIEEEQVLQNNRFAFHALYFGDVSNAAGTITQTREMDDQVHSRCDLLTNSSNWQVIARHQRHRLDTSKSVTRRIRVDGGE